MLCCKAREPGAQRRMDPGSAARPGRRTPGHRAASIMQGRRTSGRRTSGRRAAGIPGKAGRKKNILIF